MEVHNVPEDSDNGTFAEKGKSETFREVTEFHVCGVGNRVGNRPFLFFILPYISIYFHLGSLLSVLNLRTIFKLYFFYNKSRLIDFRSLIEFRIKSAPASFRFFSYDIRSFNLDFECKCGGAIPILMNF